MTSKLKCPVCPWCNQPKVLQDDIFVCANTDCSACAESFLHKALTQAKKDLDFFIKEQVRTQTALIERTKELDKCQKDLEIATKALKDIAELALAHDDIAIADEVVGVFDMTGNKDIADKIRNQIEHKVDDNE